ncbi:MAG: alpha/beta hydrolase [Bacteriovoracaceae bacterium]|nr:alpha/beta hydrolase [Bacteriovoracaceae bacterium]
MFKNNYPNYYYTEDNIRIFHTTNFKPEEFNPKETLLVFNYGLVCNNAHWKDQLKYFDELEYQILTHDYRCHYSSSGSSEDVESINFKSIASDVKQLVSQYSPENIIMIGHSMGVNVTLEFAKNYPKLTSSIVLISGTVIPPQDIMFDSNIVDLVSPYIELFTKKFPKLYKKIWKTSYMNPLARIVVHQGGFNVAKVPEEFIQIYMKRIGELPSDIFLKLLKEMHDHDIINHLESIKVPTLIVGGDKDKIIPNHVQSILQKYLPESELYIVKDGSHVPQADFPDSINHRVLRFIQKHLV